MRAVPDVAFSAASHDGYMIEENGSRWIVSGTSAATPAFAGVMALAVERMGGVGREARTRDYIHSPMRKQSVPSNALGE